jgi:hypothetical protein
MYMDLSYTLQEYDAFRICNKGKSKLPIMGYLGRYGIIRPTGAIVPYLPSLFHHISLAHILRSVNCELIIIIETWPAWLSSLNPYLTTALPWPEIRVSG